ncbi:kinase-like domain-containing protein [Rhizophagus clarus]|uniref:Kinase-like domain-containing protein n=1 Tax=Rhizophagus clarus TaxID=94130 RepID=A0A8H3QXY5_9GLOM|nr:kinase-like domain-containing protein [Rhizophagus clarus]
MSYDDQCKKCGVEYARIYDANNNERIDNLIQEIQLEINELNNMILEWISYDRFNNVKEIGDKVYSAIWKDGPLEYDIYKSEYARNYQNIEVTLKLYNLQNIINEFFIGQDKNYSITYISEVLRMYGISQCPNTKDYIIVFQDIYCKKCGKQYTNIVEEWCESCQMNYFGKNWVSSGNEKIDNLIHEMQLKINYESDIVFEWIPYEKLNDIQEISKYDFDKMHYATWEDGPLYYTDGEWKRKSNKMIKFNKYTNIYGISQNLYTEDYIMIFPRMYCEKCNKQYKNRLDANYEWCKSCQISNLKQNFTNWTSGNKGIDSLIKEIQLEINYQWEIIFEWVPFNQLYNIKKIILQRIYSAIWLDGPLKYGKTKNKYTKNQRNTHVTLKIYNSKNITNEFLSEVKADLNKYHGKLFGITQNPYTKNYIVIFQNGYSGICEICGDEVTNYTWCRSCYINYSEKFFKSWTSENEKINNFILKRQLKISNFKDTMFEFIPYDQFSNIEVVKKNSFATVYSAIWKDDPLLYYDKKWIRESNKKVTLKLLCLQDVVEFLKKTEKYLSKRDYSIYGISQDQDTKCYVVVFKYNLYCEKCGEEFAKYNIKFEWCRKCQLNDLKLNFTNWTSENDKIDNLIQKMQLKIDSKWDTIFEWIPYSQFSNIKKMNKSNSTKIYSAIWKNDILFYDNLYEEEQTKRLRSKITLKYSENIIDEVEKYSINKKYGITLDPDTKDYIIILENQYCMICDKIYTYTNKKWSIWKDGPLFYNGYEYIKFQKKVALKEIYNSENITMEFLNEIKGYSIKRRDQILIIYGISQNPNTKNYILVLNYAEGGNLCSWVNKHYKKIDWSYNLKALLNIIEGLKEIHQKDMVHRDLHTGNILSISTSLDATGRQPFANKAHDTFLALKICGGVRPDINDQEAPKCYIDLMMRCWDSNPNNRPKATEIEEVIRLFHGSYVPDSIWLPREKKQQYYYIEEQFKSAEEYKEINFLSLEEKRWVTTHPQAFYTSQLLYPFTKDLPKYNDPNSECLDCEVIYIN